MAPFPEAEDMTIKRLYVALKRNDMQLLQMGAHKLHEKYHTGHRFELIDDLKQILSYVEEQDIPSDIKDLLIRTINNILNGDKPQYQNDFTPFEEENNVSYVPQNTQENTYYEEDFKQDNYKNENSTSEEPVIFTPKENSPLNIIYPENPTLNTQENIIENSNENITQEENNNQENIENNFEENTQNQDVQSSEKQEQIEDNSITSQEEYIQDNTQENTKEVHFEEVQNEQTIQNKYIEEETCRVEVKNNYVFEKKISVLENVVVFYDDKAPITDYAQNKLYRMELDCISLSKEAHPIENAAINKNLVDTPTDEINEILKMVNTTKGEVYFVTTSKSENIIKTFIGNGINFKIPLVNDKYVDCKAINLLPLFGLTNIFSCPKCGEKEYFGGMHNKVLTMQCKNCSSTMYPDIYESENYQTNAYVYYWIKALNSMAKANTWILINPPLENAKGIVFELIKSAFEVARPDKVYILSKETTKKEYYKQIFKEIYQNCEIKSDYITQSALCEDFINSEMPTLGVYT